MCLPTLGWGAHIRALGLVVVVVVVMEVRRGWSDFDLFSWFLYHLVRSVSAGLSRTCTWVTPVRSPGFLLLKEPH